MQFDGVNWNKYTASEGGLLSDFILCVAIDRRDRKWLGTNDGLCVFDGNRWTSYTTRNSKLPHNIVLSLAIDKDNVKWVGTLEGLCRFDGTSWKLFSTDDCPIPGNQINDLAFDQEGNLWMATDGGVAVYDTRSQWDVFAAGQGQLPRCMFQNLTIDKNNNVYVGSDERGLFCLSGYKMRNPEAEAQAAAEEEARRAALAEAQGEGDKAAAEEAAGTGDERVKITPYLAEGYITITTGSATAALTFRNERGEVVRTVPKYKVGGHLSIAKMAKGTYSIEVKTAKTTRTVKFTLR